MDVNESPTPDEVRRARGIRIAGIGFIFILLSGIVEFFTLNILWPVVIVIGLIFIVIGVWMAKWI
jgi:nucleoside recognition membrane protein YjiH